MTGKSKTVYTYSHKYDLTRPKIKNYHANGYSNTRF
jgi:hypothetical protein